MANEDVQGDDTVCLWPLARVRECSIYMGRSRRPSVHYVIQRVTMSRLLMLFLTRNNINHPI
jgi:hypothetical protein